LLRVVPGEAALIFSESGGSNTLLVSDLHLGLEKEMAKKGFRIPSYSVKMVERIKNMAEEFKIDRVVILGDVKHTMGKVEDIDWGILPWFFETMLDLFPVVDVVPGNHDGSIRTLIPPRVRLHPSDGTVLGEGRSKVGVAHGHAWPSESAIATGRLVIGHSHFKYEMEDKFGSRSRESVWIFAPYVIDDLLSSAGFIPRKKGTGELVVMPPFNKMVGGQPINRGRSFEFGPVLSSGCVKLDGADVFMLDGTRVS
jgi:putative SbcD/Mre11-related phosphoesterase